MEFYERVSGARMHAAYVRPGGVALVRLSRHSVKSEFCIYILPVLVSLLSNFLTDIWSIKRSQCPQQNCNDHVDTDKHYVNTGNQNTHIRNINNRSCSVPRVWWDRKQKYPWQLEKVTDSIRLNVCGQTNDTQCNNRLYFGRGYDIC